MTKLIIESVVNNSCIREKLKVAKIADLRDYLPTIRFGPNREYFFPIQKWDLAQFSLVITSYIDSL